MLAGCGFGPAGIEPHQTTPGSEAPCAALISDVPDGVSDAVRRDVRGDVPAVAGWGDPVIVLRCGVGPPPEYEPDALLTEIDGVAWLSIDGEGGMFFATVDRDPIVEVAVPSAYEPEFDVLADLAPAILAHIPERTLG
jgi:hypothetical protein